MPTSPSWERNHSPGDPVDEHMQPLFDLLDTLKSSFCHDANALEIVNREMMMANEWILVISPTELEHSQRTLGSVESTEGVSRMRSIFDDIDA